MADSAGNDSNGRENDNVDQDVISMLDVLAEEKQLEDDAEAVLGDSDDKNCTYENGYTPRQALYACLTCTPPDGPPGGVCLACSLECHEGHDLCELYTKRSFRCDCGNSKFTGRNCKLYPNKATLNTENRYNHNFRGLYCSCKRPYPDPEDDIEDEMIQCILCEDWHHGRHLGSGVFPSIDFQEMICQGCMEKHTFLWYYNVKSAAGVCNLRSAESRETVDVATAGSIAPTAGTSSAGASTSGGISTLNRTESLKPLIDVNKNNAEITKSKDRGCKESEAIKLKIYTENEPLKNSESGASNGNNSSLCKLEDLKKRDIDIHASSATYWPENWRQKLCVCLECKDMYRDQGIKFITEESDTVNAYEERGKAKRATGSQYEQGMQVLSNMNRVQQVEVLHGYNDLKSELKDYLKKFAENGKVVREEDIREFFTQMQARKRQRVAPSMFHNCR